MSANRFAILKEYPADGFPVEQRQKVRREKDRHVPGTGRTDRVKREGRGAANVGNYKDDLKYDDEPEQQESGEEVVEEAPKVAYVSATEFFSDSESDSDVPYNRPPVAVAEEYASVISKNVKSRPVHSYQPQEAEGDEFEYGFISTDQAEKMRAERARNQRGRGRGGNRPRGQRTPRGDRPKDEGRPRSRARRQEEETGVKIERPKRNNQQGEEAQDGQQRKPRNTSNPPRNQRPSGVQHQRQGNNNQRQQRRNDMSIHNFPALGSA